MNPEDVALMVAWWIVSADSEASRTTGKGYFVKLDAMDSKKYATLLDRCRKEARV